MPIYFGHAPSPLFTAVLKHRRADGDAGGPRAGQSDEVTPSGSTVDPAHDSIRSFVRSVDGKATAVDFRDLERRATLPVLPSPRIRVSPEDVEAAVQKTTAERQAELRSGRLTPGTRILPKDTTVNPDLLTFSASNPTDSEAAYARHCARVGKVEGFHVTVETTRAENAPALVAQNLSVALVPETSRWLEDCSEVLSDGGRLIPAFFDERDVKPLEVLSAGRVKRFQPQGLENFHYYGERVGSGNFQRVGVAEGLASGAPVRQALSHIEGGNNVPATLADGRGYTLVGADGFELTRVLLEKETGRSLDDEAVKNFIAADQGLEPENIHRVEQPGAFHLDMRLMALAPGHVVLNDAVAASEKQIKWLFADLEEIARARGAGAQEVAQAKKELGALADDLREAAAERAKFEAVSERDLFDAGLQVHRLGAVFFDVEDQEREVANFLNGRTGRNEEHQTFAILMGGDPRQEASVAEELLTLRGSALDHVHFVGPSLTRGLLESSGGLKCLSKLEGHLDNE